MRSRRVRVATAAAAADSPPPRPLPGRGNGSPARDTSCATARRSNERSRIAAGPASTVARDTIPRRPGGSGRSAVLLAQAGEPEADAALRRAQRDAGAAGDLVRGHAAPVREHDRLALGLREAPQRVADEAA